MFSGDFSYNKIYICFFQRRTPLHQPDETPQPLLQDHDPMSMMPATPLAPLTPLAPPTPYAPPSMLSPSHGPPTPMPSHTPLPVVMTPAPMGLQEDLSHLGMPPQTPQDMMAQGKFLSHFASFQNIALCFEYEFFLLHNNVFK